MFSPSRIARLASMRSRRMASRISSTILSWVFSSATSRSALSRCLATSRSCSLRVLTSRSWASLQTVTAVLDYGNNFLYHYLYVCATCKTFVPSASEPIKLYINLMLLSPQKWSSFPLTIHAHSWRIIKTYTNLNLQFIYETFNWFSLGSWFVYCLLHVTLLLITLPKRLQAQSALPMRKIQSTKIMQLRCFFKLLTEVLEFSLQRKNVGTICLSTCLCFPFQTVIFNDGISQVLLCFGKFFLQNSFFLF